MWPPGPQVADADQLCSKASLRVGSRLVASRRAWSNRSRLFFPIPGALQEYFSAFQLRRFVGVVDAHRREVVLVVDRWHLRGRLADRSSDGIQGQ
jgi:hypothetical protein